MTKVRLLTDGGFSEELADLDYSKTFTATEFTNHKGTVLGYDVDCAELCAAGAVSEADREPFYFSVSHSGIECEVVDE